MPALVLLLTVKLGYGFVALSREGAGNSEQRSPFPKGFSDLQGTGGIGHKVAARIVRLQIELAFECPSESLPVCEKRLSLEAE